MCYLIKSLLPPYVGPTSPLKASAFPELPRGMCEAFSGLHFCIGLYLGVGLHFGTDLIPSPWPLAEGG